MRIKHPHQNYIKKESLRCVFFLGEVKVLQVGGNYAGVGARYQVDLRGSATKDIHSCIVGDEGVPPRPPLSATTSQPSRNKRLFVARHQGGREVWHAAARARPVPVASA